jgi:hypothetical protein
MPAERNERGHFLPGCGGGPGRPRREAEESYVNAVRAGAPPAAVKAILKMLVVKALAGDGNERAALAVLRCVLGGDSPLALEVKAEVEELRLLVAEQDRARARDQQQQQQTRTNGSPRPWQPRHLRPDDGNGNGTDHADGADHPGDQSDPDLDGGSGLPPLFS